MFLFDPEGVERFDLRMNSIQIKSLRDFVFAKYKFPDDFYSLFKLNPFGIVVLQNLKIKFLLPRVKTMNHGLKPIAMQALTII
jgi:hypothetical protein